MAFQGIKEDMVPRAYKDSQAARETEDLPENQDSQALRENLACKANQALRGLREEADFLERMETKETRAYQEQQGPGVERVKWVFHYANVIHRVKKDKQDPWEKLEAEAPLEKLGRVALRAPEEQEVLWAITVHQDPLGCQDLKEKRVQSGNKETEENMVTKAIRAIWVCQDSEVPLDNKGPQVLREKKEFLVLLGNLASPVSQASQEDQDWLDPQVLEEERVYQAHQEALVFQVQRVNKGYLVNLELQVKEVNEEHKVTKDDVESLA
ncbi:hypothetical protein U0070_027021 [Myodes glareolus]|uniref:Uncharacterized protein n=1 Tax=Myodes glareolus TaxID=447135 RepID=A0AAW0IJQ1_MYOGA